MSTYFIFFWKNSQNKVFPFLSFYSITTQFAGDLGNVTSCKATGSLPECISHPII